MEVMEESVYGGDYYTVLNDWKTTNAKTGKMNIFLSKISAQRIGDCPDLGKKGGAVVNPGSPDKRRIQ
jgi:hypothetical protein